MADTLHLEIVTAGGAAVDTQAQQVTLPLADGDRKSTRLNSSHRT